MSNQPDGIDYKLAYEKLRDKTKEMIETQKLYFKTRDIQVLKKSKAIEAEVYRMVNPKPQSTLSFDFLAQ